jgi:arylsulfatase A-like enzyme
MKRSTLLLALALFASCDKPAPLPDVVIVTVDTLRADHLGAYGSATPTPRIDGLAAASTLFEHAHAPMPLTRPSHFSMLTSLYPREHGALNNAQSLPDSSETLTELLGEAGYRTGGFVGVTLLGPASGAGQGFDHYDQPIGARERPAGEVIENALAWVGGLERDERFFLWVHLFDPHLPYDPPQEFRGGIPAKERPVDWSALVEIADANDGNIPAAVLEEQLALYRGEVAYVDSWIGKLLDGLAEKRSVDNTLFVFTADHGECFENGIYFEHADCLWEPGIHIPLTVRYPSMFEAGQRVEAQSSMIDIAPTVLRAVGIDVPESMSGLPLQDHAGFGERHVLVQHPFYQPAAAERRPRLIESVRSVAGQPTAPILTGVERVGLVGPGWKFLRTTDAEHELYALEPVDEPHNRADDEATLAGELERLLDRKLEEHPLTVLETGNINPELLETLRALGYL